MTKPITRENTPVNQIAAMAERIERLELSLIDMTALAAVALATNNGLTQKWRLKYETAKALLSSGDQG